MAAEVEIEGVLNVARQVLQTWTLLKAAREQALAGDRPAAVGRFSQPILATHSNLFTACWTATGWKRSEKENRVVVVLRQYALSILSRGEYSGELWLDGDDHRRCVHAHIERLSGEQVHKTDWSRQAQSILDSGAKLDAVERAALMGCLTAKAITAGVQALLDTLTARSVAFRSEETASPYECASPGTADSDVGVAPAGGAPVIGAPVSEPDKTGQNRTEPANEPARRRG